MSVVASVSSTNLVELGALRNLRYNTIYFCLVFRESETMQLCVSRYFLRIQH